jgi:hypothetical protein
MVLFFCQARTFSIQAAIDLISSLQIHSAEALDEAAFYRIMLLCQYSRGAGANEGAAP